jgi:hypothetical protein
LQSPAPSRFARALSLFAAAITERGQRKRAQLIAKAAEKLLDE